MVRSMGLRSELPRESLKESQTGPWLAWPMGLNLVLSNELKSGGQRVLMKANQMEGWMAAMLDQQMEW